MPLFPNQKIISGDAHFVEPPDLFKTQLPVEFRDHAPTTWKGELPDGGGASTTSSTIWSLLPWRALRVPANRT